MDGYCLLARAIFLLLDATKTDHTNASTFPNNTRYYKGKQTKYNKTNKRDRTMNGKIGPVDLTKNENGRVCLTSNSSNGSLLILCL